MSAAITGFLQLPQATRLTGTASPAPIGAACLAWRRGRGILIPVWTLLSLAHVSAFRARIIYGAIPSASPGVNGLFAAFRRRRRAPEIRKGGRGMSNDDRNAAPDARPEGSLVDRAHEEIHRRITDGVLRDGERLVIDRFARELGMSLIPVREALARLSAQGLVSSERNKGYRVAPQPSADDIRLLFEARLALEESALAIAVETGSDIDLAPLRAINASIAEGAYGVTYAGFRDFVALNERFHVALVALAGNRHLEDAYRRLAYHQQITRPTYGHGVPDLAQIVREHDMIVTALTLGDVTAVRGAIRAHILGGRDRLFDRRAQAAS